MSEIQWYPGHMTKAKRNMEKDIRLVDLVIEILDARVPRSTQNPDIRKLCQDKQRLILLNKADLADPAVTKLWCEKLSEDGSIVIPLDSRSRDSLSGIHQALSRLTAAKKEKDLSRGITGTRAIKAMVLGIPNVGKSTLINSITGKVTAVTGNKPGVTKGNQWINAGKELLLLDTPGVLWPKFEDRQVGYHLACIGAINDDILDAADLAMFLSDRLLKYYPEAFMERYHFTPEELEERTEQTDDLIPGLNRKALASLELVACKRNCIKKGAQPDYDRASRLMIDDFRTGKTGRISLERP